MAAILRIGLYGNTNETKVVMETETRLRLLWQHKREKKHVLFDCF